MAATGIVQNARERVRTAMRADIVAEARRQLAIEGAAALSLRAVARELGMASSAMYRYFPSRDELLTALIVEGYDALGEVAEAAAASSRGGLKRVQTVCRAVRGWALDHPHEYALLYGSPIPGYQAPGLTVGPASRATLALTGIVLDAHRASELSVPDDASLSRAVASDVRPIGELTMPGVPLPTVARALAVWTMLFGQINFELFGRFEGVVENTDVLFEHAVSIMAGLLGLTQNNSQQRRQRNVG
jgi:AcrR family transcriptional regulator